MERFAEVYFLIQVGLAELYFQQVVKVYGSYLFIVIIEKNVAFHIN